MKLNGFEEGTGMLQNLDYKNDPNPKSRLKKSIWARLFPYFYRNIIRDPDILLPVMSTPMPWSGLSRYKTTDVPLLKSTKQAYFDEYAKVSNFLDCDESTIEY